MQLNREHCYQALLTHDPRFDGTFFVAVKTTKIYCRPVCKVKPVLFKNCTFFLTAAQAEQFGFRPCLRCRPELAPGNAPLDSVSRLAAIAISKIEDGILSKISVRQLAHELGVSDRTLRRVMESELGVSPLELAQTHRLLLAKRLLTDTKLPITEIAYASGFASIRRFNTVLKKQYNLSPRDFRKNNTKNQNQEFLICEIAYRSPMAWQDLLLFLQIRAIAGVEWTDGTIYRRTVKIGKHIGWLEASLCTDKKAILAKISISLAPVMTEVIAGLKRLFDLYAEPKQISKHLGTLAKAKPGLRVPGAFNFFEVCIRAILGQQVSVKAASTLATRLAHKYGETIDTPFNELNLLSPEPSVIESAKIKDMIALGITKNRATTIQCIAKVFANNTDFFDSADSRKKIISKLHTIRGVGKWTLQYISMRILADPNAFPHTDLGILKALNVTSPKTALMKAEKWQPWRAYAAMHLWKSLEKA